MLANIDVCPLHPNEEVLNGGRRVRRKSRDELAQLFANSTKIIEAR